MQEDISSWVPRQSHGYCQYSPNLVIGFACLPSSFYAILFLRTALPTLLAQMALMSSEPLCLLGEESRTCLGALSLLQSPQPIHVYQVQECDSPCLRQGQTLRQSFYPELPQGIRMKLSSAGLCILLLSWEHFPDKLPKHKFHLRVYSWETSS